jgi:hypothetical protein
VIDAVLSYHMNPATCGVAKFNHALAKRLGVPCDQLSAVSYQHPLWSVKASEVGADWPAIVPPFDVLWHDAGVEAISRQAERVFYAEDLGCPSTVEGDASRGRYRVLAFGMAHKLALPHFADLKRELDREHPDYTIELSTAVHEGNPWDDALTTSVEAMRAIFGDRLRVLGFLADDALARVLQEVDAVAAFYAPALRANNTSAWCAVAAGKRLFTNRDADSPTEMPTWPRLIAELQAGAPEQTGRGFTDAGVQKHDPNAEAVA